MIGASQWVGIVMLILAAVWGFLFVNPKSPVRSRWWSISTKLGVVIINPMAVGDKYLTVYVGLRTISDIQVDEISLRIGRKLLLSDWNPKLIQADEPQYINFARPDWLHFGEYKASLKAQTPEGFSKI